MHTSDFNYVLPSSRIAKFPPKIRGNSRLMVMDKTTGNIKHTLYNNLPQYLEPGDLVVLNNTKVFPARLTANSAGKNKEFLLLEGHSKKLNTHKWKVVYKGKVKVGEEFKVGNSVVTISQILGDGLAIISSSSDLQELAKIYGKTPLPPYLHRQATANDSFRYQTVFANSAGSSAAPTASLNFTLELIDTLTKQNINVVFVTLHIGLGTFLPIRTNNIKNHKMHSEFFEIPSNTIKLINQTKKSGNKILAVGTTVTRTLEYANNKIIQQPETAITGEADIFIYPGYKFNIVDKMLTNFHAPKSTILMMAGAFASWENLMIAYSSALEENYKFLSYGDSMLII